MPRIAHDCLDPRNRSLSKSTGPQANKALQDKLKQTFPVSLPRLPGGFKTGRQIVFLPGLEKQGQRAVMEQVQKLLERFVLMTRMKSADDQVSIVLRESSLRADQSHEIDSQFQRLVLQTFHLSPDCFSRRGVLPDLQSINLRSRKHGGDRTAKPDGFVGRRTILSNRDTFLPRRQRLQNLDGLEKLELLRLLLQQSN
jgi:hypothetical protein